MFSMFGCKFVNIIRLNCLEYHNNIDCVVYTLLLLSVGVMLIVMQCNCQCKSHFCDELWQTMAMIMIYMIYIYIFVYITTGLN